MYYKLLVLVVVFILSAFLGGCTLLKNSFSQLENNDGLYTTPAVNNYEEGVPNTNPDPTIIVKEGSSLEELDKTLNDFDNLENFNIETSDIDGGY